MAMATKEKQQQQRQRQQVISRFFSPKPPAQVRSAAISSKPPPPSARGDAACELPSPSPAKQRNGEASLPRLRKRPLRNGRTAAGKEAEQGDGEEEEEEKEEEDDDDGEEIEEERKRSGQGNLGCSSIDEGKETYERKRRREDNSSNASSLMVAEILLPNHTEGNGLTSFHASKASGKPHDDLADRSSLDLARHRKFVEKLLVSMDSEPLQGSRPSNKLPPKDQQYTPLEQQVIELKAKHKGILLMVEVGYKYRMFGEDAEVAARVLGVFAYNDHNFITASIPTFRLHVHVRRLVEAGYKVGVVKQTETAAIKAHGGNKVGPFTRGLSALYSRATLEAATDLGGDSSTENSRASNYLMCVAEKMEGSKPVKQEVKHNVGVDPKSVSKGAYDSTIGVVAVETATGDVMFGQFNDTVTRTELEAHLLACSPAEILLASPLMSSTEKLVLEFTGQPTNARIERIPRDSLGSAAMSEVLEFYQGKENSKPEDQKSDGCQNEGRFDEGIEAILAMPDLVIQALALALRYLSQFGLERILRLGATFRPFASSSEMSLSSNTLQQLEILQNNADGTSKGSLLWLMDHTNTAFGGRLLHHWLIHPLCDQSLISNRLDAVSEIVDTMGSVADNESEGSFPGSRRGGGSLGSMSRGSNSKSMLGVVLMALKKAPDIERGITRIFHGTANPSEFISVIQALLTAVTQLQQICQENDDGMVEYHSEGNGIFKAPLLKRLLAAASSSVVREHASRLLSSLNKEAAHCGDKHNLFVCGSGKFPMVEKCKAAVESAEQCLVCLLPQYRKLLKMPNLQYLSVSGTTHLIEVSINQRVPHDWIKVCSTKKTNRYHTPDVLQALDALALAKEELTVECNKAWDSFLADFSMYYIDFRSTVHAFAALDCLYSLAIVSRNQGYTRPTFVEQDSAQLIIEGGRHPVLEATLQEGFVPNDTCLYADGEHCQIITGPNMGGKSCYIRQVALIAIMAQVGSYVPAISVKLRAFDAIYTRMGASDNIQRGSSTFLEELNEASIILRNATPYSLVIMDELGRGTSTHDGVAIAYATLNYLLKDIKCLTLFVTHYPRLAELTERYPHEMGAYHVSYLVDKSSLSEASEVMCKQFSDKDNGASTTTKSSNGEDENCDAAQKITFLYKLVKGIASRSFGLHVARLAQIPETCIMKASTMAARLENEVKSRTTMAKTGYTQGDGDDDIENDAIEGGEGEHVEDDLGSRYNGLDVAKVADLCSSILSALSSPREELLPTLKMAQARAAKCRL